ncbi:MAG TPA: Hsp70 family protein, partial [Polyangiaceae bacterium LLY-WYZ-14_1]|nr:Hsp70 family protein [Polyangiaceae bacterium LLY-WYZ-14_1]
EADQYRQSDVKRRELADLKNSAETLLYTSERAVTECAGIVPAEVIEVVQGDIDHLRALLEGAGDAVAITEALRQLELSAYRMAESMYGTDEGGGA